MAKVLAINGSPRINGNTTSLINIVFQELNQHGIDTEMIQIGYRDLSGCKACYSCRELKNNACIYYHDEFNEVFAKCVEADGIILASPVYVGGMTSQLKAFIDRACLVSRANDHSLKRKIGASIVAVRRNGALQTFHAINTFFTISQIMIVSSSYWNQGIGRNPGDVMDDLEGIQTMKVLGENMAWLLEKVSKT
ncbi:MAG: flavodoxin family protein [Bacteroidia bacterium]|nr:flavodoxin family protein [Bacteroidia bacterium]